MNMKVIDAEFPKTIRWWQSRIIEKNERLKIIEPYIEEILAKKKLEYKDYEKMLLIMNWVDWQENNKGGICNIPLA